MSQVARPSYPFTLIVVPILPIPLVEIVVLVLLGMLVAPIVFVASGGISRKRKLAELAHRAQRAERARRSIRTELAQLAKRAQFTHFCTTINRYVDGGHDVPGVTGVPAVHGVAKLIDGPIFDLPGHSQRYLLFGGVFLAVATKVYKIPHDSLLGHVRAHGKIYASSRPSSASLALQASRGKPSDSNICSTTHSAIK